MKDVRQLFFDVGGTIFDWKNTAKREIEALAQHHGQQVDSEAFAREWRTTMFTIHNQVRIGDRPWQNADQMHFVALEQMAPRFPILNDVDKMALVRSTWHNLDVFPGAPDTVTRLRTRFTVMVLTILGMESIVRSSKSGAVVWDGIFSCELFGVYKPSLESYRRAVKIMGLRPEQACMVAAHRGDLACASEVGLRTAYVKAPVEDHVEGGFQEDVPMRFDCEAENYEELCAFFGV